MIVDSSAILAIALQEPEAAGIASVIAEAPVRRMCAVNWLEALMVVESRHGAESADELRLMLRELEIEPLAFDGTQAAEAHAAWRKFGRGRHPAALNLGDCCAYAASIVTGEPLLYKGGDFSRTDVEAVRW